MFASRYTDMVKKILARFSSLFKVNDTPKSIAKGFALGTLIGMFPVPGIQVVISVLLASLLKWNKIAASIAVFNTNLVTGPFIFALNYAVGRWLLDLHPDFTIPNEFGVETLKLFLTAGKDVLYSLWFGGLVLGLPFSFLSYYVILWFFKKRRRKDSVKVLAV